MKKIYIVNAITFNYIRTLKAFKNQNDANQYIQNLIDIIGEKMNIIYSIHEVELI